MFKPDNKLLEVCLRYTEKQKLTSNSTTDENSDRLTFFTIKQTSKSVNKPVSTNHTKPCQNRQVQLMFTTSD